MKKLLTLLLFFPAIVFSQFQVENGGNLYFEEVYDVELEKQNIKDKVNEWIALNFNDSNNVIKMNTDEKIIANGLFKVDQTYPGGVTELNVNFSMITEFKEGKYKLLINNLTMGDAAPVKESEIGNFEEYKAALMATTANLKGQAKKYAEKMYKDEEKMKSDYEQILSGYNASISKIKQRIEGMAADLNTHVKQSSAKSDW